jgi:hypothetical protein
MNPYAAPQIEGDNLELAPYLPEEAREQIRLPAYGLIATGCLGAVLAALAMLAAIFAPSEPEKALISPVVDRSMSLIAGILLIVLQVAILRGGLALLRLETYRTARWGAILAVASLGGACLVGLPFGLWAMLRLHDGRIRGAFART